MRIIALDIHRSFAEAVVLADGRLRRLGRVELTREHLDRFAATLRRDDAVVVEATGNEHTVCQIGVFVAYVSGTGHAVIDRRRYLPRSWTGAPDRFPLHSA
jgi:hypothetical protein